MANRTLLDFVRESNRIEGINRDPTPCELVAHETFLACESVTIPALVQLVAVLQPGAVLRDKPRRDVRVGSYYPPPGGPKIRAELLALLDKVNVRSASSWEVHIAYEDLHPFTDGNGRSGRAVWLWMERGYAPIGFLHRWYYSSLQNAPARRPPNALS
ncbi:MAG: hypothetical protein DDT20_00855 [Firmicutes bacterium]|nr:hypothetical protein [Bacillota bacterium]